MRAPLAALAAIVAACASPGGGGPATAVVHLGEVVDARGEGRADVALDLDGSGEVVIELDGEERVVEIAARGAVEAWERPRPVFEERLVYELAGTGETTVTVWARGAPVPEAARVRSLVWIEPAIVDDPAIVGLGRVMAAAADDGHGGLLLDHWFRRFGTTVHSERVGPTLLVDQVAVTQGDDPRAWDLDALPFRVTAVHNRLDLAARNGGCGELRVSLASTDPVYAPLHIIFLFRQEPAADDVAPDGTVHCHGAARRWGRLAGLDGDDLVAAADALLTEALRPERFLLAESVELTVSPWEWRQWAPVPNPDPQTSGELPVVLDNPPLFQTVDIPRLNQPGPPRDDFLAFAAANAEALAARDMEIPARFRPPSARVPPTGDRELLDLGALGAEQPGLVAAIEIVGCPTCHTTDAEFVQTTPQRTFSDFYDRELDARAVYLDTLNAGVDPGVPPFGPLQ